MSRRPLAAAALLAFASISCEPLNRAEEPEALPPVAAAPPVPAAAPTSSAAEESAEREWVGDVVSRLVRHRTGLTRPELKSLAQTLYDEAHAHGLDPSLVLGVIEVESSYDNFAVSPVGAIGLMQILPSTGKELAEKLEVPWEGPQTLFDPQVNLRLGVAYLAQMRQRYGNLSTALAAYNCGPRCIDRRLVRGGPIPASYARRVLDAYGAHDARLGSL